MAAAEDIQRYARQFGLDDSPVERAASALEALNDLGAVFPLGKYFALTGGTALHCFHGNMARLSFDIDLNWTRPGLTSREHVARRFSEALHVIAMEVGGREHPGIHGAWEFVRESPIVGSVIVRSDINTNYAPPLWANCVKDSRVVAGVQACNIPVADYHEMMAAKIGAMLRRRESRDFFDVTCMFSYGSVDLEKLHIALAVQAVTDGRMRHHFAQPLAQLASDLDIFEDLKEALPVSAIRRFGAASEPFNTNVQAAAEQSLRKVLPLPEKVYKFLTDAHENGVIDPATLTSDPTLQEIIRIRCAQSRGKGG